MLCPSPSPRIWLDFTLNSLCWRRLTCSQHWADLNFRWAVNLLESVISWNNRPVCPLSLSPCSLHTEHYTFISTTPHLPSVPALHFLQGEIGLSVILIWSPFFSPVFSFSLSISWTADMTRKSRGLCASNGKIKPLNIFGIFAGLSFRTMKATD